MNLKKDTLFIHKFNMHFIYYAVLFMIISMGFTLISGKILTRNPIYLDLLYNTYGWIKNINIIFGIIFYIMSFFLILSRLAFYGYLKEAAIIYNATLGVSFLLVLIYQMILKRLVHISITWVLVETVVFIAILVSNIFYYKNHYDEI